MAWPTVQVAPPGFGTSWTGVMDLGAGTARGGNALLRLTSSCIRFVSVRRAETVVVPEPDAASTMSAFGMNVAPVKLDPLHTSPAAVTDTYDNPSPTLMASALLYLVNTTGADRPMPGSVR